MASRTETLGTYLTDMHALEKHLLEAFEKQLNLSQNTPEAHQVVQQLVSSTRQHIAALEQRASALGQSDGGVGAAVKSAVSGVLGVAAGVVDHLRPESVSKALRDSYTATNHAIIGYIMLQTTGVALNDTETATLAQRHLQDHVSNAQAIANVMPSLVVADLADDPGGVNQGAASQVTGSQQLGFLFHSTGGSSNAVGS